MAPVRHDLDRAWELATSANDLPEWGPEPQLLHVLTPGRADAWACGTRRKILWRLHAQGRDARPVRLKLVTADQWRGTVAQLATEVDPRDGGTEVTVPELPLGTYWIQVSRGSRLLATSRPFAIGPAGGARTVHGLRRLRPRRPRASAFPSRYGA
ncbi:hypothetical protein ACFYZ9_18280 [Streptomyces sp. NPDC001691]|uniref:hypothetical protein n=1 Tax=Streptomyces sp. NPDC001691 TaxID=3364600 RepID=UPI0036B39A67